MLWIWAFEKVCLLKKTPMRKGLLVLLLLSSTLVWSQSRERKKVRTAVEALHQALIAADSTSLKKLTADSLRFGHSNGSVEDKPTFIHNAVYGRFKFLSIATADQRITVANRQATVDYLLTATATNNGEPVNLKLNVKQVWQKQRKQWKLLARQAAKQ